MRNFQYNPYIFFRIVDGKRTLQKEYVSKRQEFNLNLRQVLLIEKFLETIHWNGAMLWF